MEISFLGDRIEGQGSASEPAKCGQACRFPASHTGFAAGQESKLKEWNWAIVKFQTYSRKGLNRARARPCR